MGERHDPTVLVREAASLSHLIGGMAPKHLTIVGGLVPPLLVPDAIDRHKGSADLDLCLSLAITKGSTREYYNSIEKIIEPYFEMVSQSGFRWRKKEGVGGVPLLLDFLAPCSHMDATMADGTRQLDHKAVLNTGQHLRPFPLRSGEVIDQDAVTVKAEAVELVYRPGVRADVTIRHAGPVGFLAAKADALGGRDDPKDGYDISWWCLNAKPSPEEVAELVIKRPAFKATLFPESVALLQAAFRAPDYPGPSGYAYEKHSDLEVGNEVFERSRNRAYLAVSRVVKILKRNLWT